MKITPKFERLSVVTIELTPDEVKVIGLNAEEATNSFVCNELIRAIKRIAKEHNL